MQQEPRVARTKFGDGYEQRSPDGINNSPAKWAMQFRACGKLEGDAIIAFFRQHAGYLAFDWTPPRETVAGRWTCPSWQRGLPNADGESDISATFEQVFEP